MLADIFAVSPLHLDRTSEDRSGKVAPFDHPLYRKSAKAAASPKPEARKANTVLNNVAVAKRSSERAKIAAGKSTGIEK